MLVKNQYRGHIGTEFTSILVHTPPLTTGILAVVIVVDGYLLFLALLKYFKVAVDFHHITVISLVLK